ncbi:hypothetical protein ONS95_009203 [Cadophora gregata]|uniref:uncharacterized protein n=1 Tax=Cadophora gregata TaxID=51156 RepID=UPI0026DB893A|nr:uncharacterized protein ONS95_009203 [Cadophora gregata]KAK0124227.1 hypothetical protein ONS95_009203 [Cadophora gregata]
MAPAQWPETPFIPKQAQPKSAELFERIIGNSSEIVAQHILSSRLPLIPANSVIHDNGCGTLQVTSEIFTPTASNPSPPPNITIHATDSNVYQISAASAKALSNNWPVQTAVMKAQELTFPSDFFTHSFTNFVIMGLTNRPLAAQQIYRTLKPGGAAVVVTWAYMPHDIPLKKAHLATRSQDKELRIQWGGDLLLESTLRDFYRDGGFQDEKVDIRPFELWLEAKDLRAWAEGLWSFLGDTEEGWSKEDEERWEEAIQIVVEEVEKEEAYVRNVNEKGGKLRFIAHVGLATK